jgi:hypothetical protein
VKAISKFLAGALVAWFLSSAGEPPKPTGLTEKLETRLVQLDVAVEGDPEAIRAITAKDFALYVGEHAVQGLIVDRLCGDAPTPAGVAPDTSKVVPQVSRPRASFVFFFDQTHLTMAGRTLSLVTSKDLIERLVVGGSQASIVSNARRLETIVPMTTDKNRLLAALDRLRDDPTQWEDYAEGETRRAEELGNAEGSSETKFGRGARQEGNTDTTPQADQIRSSLPSPVCLKARVYAREEWQMVRQTTQRIGITVSTLAEVPAPKALVYFGDTLRQKAGLHYLSLAGCPQIDIDSGRLTASAAIEIDAAINEATARDVHFFTVQAEGLKAYFPGSPTDPYLEAQNTLVALAAETGGEAFLGGASNKYIADRIESLTSCRLLLSFPPGDLPRDKAMNVTLVLSVPKVKIQTQGRVVVPSAASLERSRLLAAFVDPVSSDDGSLRALLIPRGGDGKNWKAAVQLRLRPTGLPDNSAELGASIVRRDKVTDHFAASIATASGSRAMVLEKSLDIAPGPFAIVAVARDVKRGDVGSSRLDADWPNPAKSGAAIAPIAVLQAGPAAISKDGAVSSSGSIARDVDEMLDPSIGVSLTSVVCRGGKAKGSLVVERWLEDGSPNEFEPMTIPDTDAPCVQTVDVVRAGRLRPGGVDYRVVARVGDEIVAQERRALRVGTTP